MFFFSLSSRVRILYHLMSFGDRFHSQPYTTSFFEMCCLSKLAPLNYELQIEQANKLHLHDAIDIRL